MKTLMKAIAGVMLVGLGSCASNNSYLEVDGALPAGDKCDFAPGTVFRTEGTLWASWQKQANNGTHYIVGLNAKNNLDATPLSDSNGKVFSGPERSNIYVTEVDIDYSADSSSISIPSATLQIDQQVPAKGSSPVIFDAISKEASDAIGKQSKPFKLFVTLTLKGNTGAGGSAIQSAPFTYPIAVEYPDIPVDPGTTTPCGTAKDSTSGKVLNQLVIGSGSSSGGGSGSAGCGLQDGTVLSCQPIGTGA